MILFCFIINASYRTIIPQYRDMYIVEAPYFVLDQNVTDTQKKISYNVSQVSGLLSLPPNRAAGIQGLYKAQQARGFRAYRIPTALIGTCTYNVPHGYEY